MLLAALSEWLPSDDLAYFVSEVVGQMDLSDIAALLGRGATGRMIEGGGAGTAVASRHRLIQLEMEGGPPECAARIRVGAEPE